MESNNHIDKFIQEVSDLFTQPNAFRSVLILLSSLAIAYWLSRFLARGIVKVAQNVAYRSDNENDDDRVIRLRQVETYLSVAVAVVRFLVVVIVGYIAWRVLSPYAIESSTASSVAAIGAGAVFIVTAGQTVGIILRDLTAGTVMISERWFNVGDFVKLEPFWDVSGVVERFTLRSTRIRALNGEVITLHNQAITGVHVTPRGVRNMAVDIFVRDKEAGEKAIKKIIAAIPKGKTMLVSPLRIVQTEEWGENRWRITVIGQTAPGREWLIEKFFVEAVIDLDDGKTGTDKLIALPPMPRFADEMADKHFKRAVRVKPEEHK
ncbi:mechanosensitive ion channel family protein [Candidatus Saccharibacteria bacterium]|nr:mechanosensitive ion channel family protein [Candidatus Saccharibacteria bacterium]